MNENGQTTIHALAGSLDPQTFLPAERRGDLINLAQSFPANAVRQAIRATAAAVRGRHTDEDIIDPNVFVPNERQIELMDMAKHDGAIAVDTAIRETAAVHLLKTRTAH